MKASFNPELSDLNDRFLRNPFPERERSGESKVYFLRLSAIVPPTARLRFLRYSFKAFRALTQGAAERHLPGVVAGVRSLTSRFYDFTAALCDRAAAGTPANLCVTAFVQSALFKVL